ncbi:hypothetical protein [Actinomycetospora cinnamomea]|uniref:hypothetical protein n=1 Tax=Actinomycetospora cinnamomea TaxID=663609 RepID=UPI000E318A30|nr:hypothetical protein [Actinomycetospora cinnamomea]
MPDPERTAARTVAAVAAATGVVVTMLLAGSGVVTVVVTAVLAVGQALLLRGGGARRARRFLLAASAQAGLTFAVAGDPTVASALVYLGVGVVFGLVVVVALGLLDRHGDDLADDEPRVDTRPLPVADE